MATRRKKRSVKKASKRAKKVVKKRAVRASTTKVAVPVASLSSELGILHRIDKRVSRIDRTVNAGKYLAHKAKKAKRQRELEAAWEERELHGSE